MDNFLRTVIKCTLHLSLFQVCSIFYRKGLSVYWRVCQLCNSSVTEWAYSIFLCFFQVSNLNLDGNMCLFIGLGFTLQKADLSKALNFRYSFVQSKVYRYKYLGVNVSCFIIRAARRPKGTVVRNGRILCASLKNSLVPPCTSNLLFHRWFYGNLDIIQKRIRKDNDQRLSCLELVFAIVCYATPQVDEVINVWQNENSRASS